MNQLIAEFFRLQEGKLLLEGEDKTGRLHELHDQIEILRGATLNGAILFTLSLFGLCALYRAQDNKKIPAGTLRILLKYASFLLAAACLLLGLWEMHQHFGRGEGHADPPLAEALIFLLGVGGLWLCLRIPDDKPRLFRNGCLIAAVLTLIGYGSWWWTEVLYDQQVIHSTINIQPNLK